MNYMEPVNSKATMIEFLEMSGIRVREEKGRTMYGAKDHRFFATKGDKEVILGSFGVGERRNWQDMYDYAMRMLAPKGLDI